MIMSPDQNAGRSHSINLMYVRPCVIYENDERYQFDATIMIYYHK